jgi:hypothetical protein
MRYSTSAFVWGFIGLAGLLFLAYCAPLEPLSAGFWTGAAWTICGVAGIAVPLKILGLRRRAHGAILAGAGVAVSAGCLLWPVSRIPPGQPAMLLDDYLAGYDFGERHERIIKASPEQVMAALKAIRVEDVGLWQTLMRIRAALFGGAALRRNQPATAAPLLTLMQQPGSGFLLLEERPLEIVMGMAGRPWANQGAPGVRDAETWKAFHEPGAIRVAFNFQVEDLGHGESRLITETRIEGTDADARRRMARYWRVIHPGSGLIRRGMLDAVEKRALHGPA